MVCLSVCDFVGAAAASGSLAGFLQSGVVGPPLKGSGVPYDGNFIDTWNFCLAPPATLYLRALQKVRASDGALGPTTLRLFFRPFSGPTPTAAALEDVVDHSEARVLLDNYAEARPAGYPATGSPLSSGTSTLKTLLMLAALFNVREVRLSDSSRVAGCFTYLALIRWTLGQPAFYEGLGFRPESTSDAGGIADLKRALQADPALKKAAERFAKARHTGDQVCAEVDAAFEQVSNTYSLKGLSTGDWIRAPEKADITSWLLQCCGESCP